MIKKLLFKLVCLPDIAPKASIILIALLFLSVSPTLLQTNSSTAFDPHPGIDYTFGGIILLLLWLGASLVGIPAFIILLPCEIWTNKFKPAKGRLFLTYIFWPLATVLLLKFFEMTELMNALGSMY